MHTEQAELLICLFELPNHCIYTVCLYVDYMLLMNINNAVLYVFGSTLTVKGKDDVFPSFGSRCQRLVRRIMRSFRSEFWYLRVFRSANGQVPHGGRQDPQQCRLDIDWLWSSFALREPRPAECPGSHSKCMTCRSSKRIGLL